MPRRSSSWCTSSLYAAAPPPSPAPASPCGPRQGRPPGDRHGPLSYQQRPRASVLRRASAASASRSPASSPSARAARSASRGDQARRSWPAPSEPVPDHLLWHGSWTVTGTAPGRFTNKGHGYGSAPDADTLTKSRHRCRSDHTARARRGPAGRQSSGPSRRRGLRHLRPVTSPPRCHVSMAGPPPAPGWVTESRYWTWSGLGHSATKRARRRRLSGACALRRARPAAARASLTRGSLLAAGERAGPCCRGFRA